jgi:hypothetical protein
MAPTSLQRHTILVIYKLFGTNITIDITHEQQYFKHLQYTYPREIHNPANNYKPVTTLEQNPTNTHNITRHYTITKKFHANIILDALHYL